MAVRTGWLPPDARPPVKTPHRFPWTAVALFTGAVLFVWFAWLWLAEGELVGAALVVGPVLVIFSLPMLYAAAKRRPDYDIAGLMLFSLVLRFGFAYYRSTHAIDSWLYHTEGMRLSAFYRVFDFGASTGAGVPGTGAMRAISGGVHVLVFDDYFASFLVMTWLAFVGCYLLYRAFELAIPDGDAPRYAKLLMLWPSMCFWPSSLGKDSWMVFTVGVASYGVARIYTRLAGGYTFLGLGLLAASFVRPHLALLAIMAFGVAFLIGRRESHRNAITPGFVAKIVGVVLILVIGSVLVSRTQKLLAIEDFSSASIQSASSYVEGQTSLGGSAFHPANPRSPTGFPVAVVTVLFRPLPVEAHGFEQLFTSIEGVTLALLTVLSFRRLLSIPRRLRSQPYVAYSLVYVLIWTLAFGVIANFGILARQRTQMLPFYFVLLCLPAVTKQARRSRERERRVLR